MFACQNIDLKIDRFLYSALPLSYTCMYMYRCVSCGMVTLWLSIASQISSCEGGESGPSICGKRVRARRGHLSEPRSFLFLDCDHSMHVSTVFLTVFKNIVQTPSPRLHTHVHTIPLTHNLTQLPSLQDSTLFRALFACCVVYWLSSLHMT